MNAHDVEIALEMAHLNCPYCQNGSTPVALAINGLWGYWHYNNDPLRPSWDMCHSSRIRMHVRQGTSR